MRRLLALFMSLVTVLSVGPGVARAHPVHVAIGEVTYEAASRKLRVNLLVRTIDLIEVLRPGTKEPIDPSSADRERIQRDDRHILDYLDRTFVIRRPNGESLPLRWIEKRPEPGSKGSRLELRLWVDVADQRETLEITNRVFFELDETQVNTLLFRSGDEKWSATFSRREPTRKVSVIPSRDGPTK